MNNQFFDKKDTLYDITEKYNETIEVLASIGFENLKDEAMRKSFGKSITLEAALKIKRLDPEAIQEKLIARILEAKEQEGGNSDKKETIKIAGALPCPVKVPLIEGFDAFLENEKLKYPLEYDLRAASMGIDWMMDTLKDGSDEELPDLFISAGFEMFFDKSLFGKYKAENLFEDITGIERYNDDFHNDYISLEDPNRQYSILGVVPAIFLINTQELNGRKIPSSWKDILSDEFENSVSLPVSDFDIFNAILLNIYKSYGEEGVKKLRKSMLTSMHPSEMVKSHIKKKNKPVVTIMPYFFTWMVKEGGPMTAVWPADGAISSPIFMLSKKEKKEQLKPIVDFFASKDVGEILSHQGKMPSVNPQVDNMVDKENKYMWLGWDFIKENDITALIEKCENIFHRGAKGEEE